MANHEHHVLQIPELLELILAQLPMRDLLLAQRVCRRFNNLIQTSIVLQQALFFRPLPKPATPEPTTTPKRPTWPPFEPSFSLPFPVSLPFPPPISNPRKQQKNHPLPESVGQNPLLVAAFPPWFSRNMSDLSYTTDQCHFSRFKDLPLAGARRDAFLRPEASWRLMMVTQPPISVMSVVRITVHTRMTTYEEVEVRFPAPIGLTMGVLYDLTCQLVLYQNGGEFRVQWSKDGGHVSLIVMRTASGVVGKEYMNYISRAYEGVSLDWPS
ncbi:putative f-box domain protein [Lasiodiplodia theobromae]|nr:putative f-box domain protein [Lasiodiplodia theobromae]